MARENGATLIPFILEGVGGVREFNLADGIQPTVKGHRLIAANVWKVLEPVLQSLLRADSARPTAAPRQRQAHARPARSGSVYSSSPNIVPRQRLAPQKQA